MRIIILQGLCFLLLVSPRCGRPGSSAVLGKHLETIQINGESREYYTHIPAGYDGSTPLPVVLMLHGSGGNGKKFYNISGWVEEGERQNIITVFPSSWSYDCVWDDSIEKHHAEKWNGYDLELCDGDFGRDDVLFLRSVIDEVAADYLIDSTRVYMVGFSNGAEMAARCAFELSDRLAAVVACAGSVPADTTISSARELPVLIQVGAADAKLLERQGTNTPLPMDFEEVLTSFPAFRSVLNSYINSYQLDTNYTLTADTTRFAKISYADIGGGSGKCEMILVKNLEHEYPNTINHPENGAALHWQWMKKERLH